MTLPTLNDSSEHPWKSKDVSTVKMGTPWKFNIYKENDALENYFPFGMPSFQALLLVSGRGGVELVLHFLYSKDLVALFRVFCIISAHYTHTHFISATIVVVSP